MRPRHRLGTIPTDLRLDRFHVNCDAVPFLKGRYELWSVERLGIAGAAPKDFVVFPEVGGFGEAYVAKKPTKPFLGTRESVTEYLIARIGAALPLRCADARLARIPAPRAAAPDVR